jgi:uncharacterized membrane protein
LCVLRLGLGFYFEVLESRNQAAAELLGIMAAATSITPFGAIVQGRNRFVPGEIGWLTLLIGVVAWAALLYLHPWLFGVAPVAIRTAMAL